VSTLDVGDAVHEQDFAVVAASPCGPMVCSSSQPAGLLGGSVLTMFVVTLDYQNGTVGFNAPAVPGGFGAPITTSFDLGGGGLIGAPSGSGTTMAQPTRIAIDVDIEGTTHPFMLDTGSSRVELAPALYDAIVADGRSQSTIQVSTVRGTSAEPATTLKEVALAGATQTNVGASRSPIDFGVLAAEIGHPIEGLLGGTYLERYLVSIDYANRQITLRPAQ
jgi:hypothetical protein